MEAPYGSQQIAEEYASQLRFWSTEFTKLKSRSFKLAWLRVITFVLAFSLPWVVTIQWSPLFYVCFAAIFMVFIAIVRLSFLTSQKQEEAGFRCDFFRYELEAADGQWTNFPQGKEFWDPAGDFAYDLDLFGDGSLYQYVNRTVTNLGQQQMAQALSTLSTNPDQIRKKQAAVAELAGMHEFRQQLYVGTRRVNKALKEITELGEVPSDNFSFIKRGHKWLVYGWISAFVLLLASLVVGLVDGMALFYFLLLGLVIAGLQFKYVNRIHSKVTKHGKTLACYAQVISTIEAQEFKSEELQVLQNQLKRKGKASSQVLQSLSLIMQAFDQRLNLFMGVLINGYLLWDILQCIRLKDWYSRYGELYQVWLDTVAQFEVQSSFAAFAYNHPDFVQAQLSPKTVFEAEHLGHPLLPNKKRVSNNFSIVNGQHICVVTGANMAGKSTFLRTVGVNWVLAGNGCPVCANKLVYKPMPFITNMRAVDNLLKNESYFFAELSRLKMILDRLKQKGELFFILDEILKGTNSHDKTNGSIQLVKQLLQHQGVGLIATHDLELGKLEDQHEGRVFNRCFEVTFSGGDLQFDYLLRDGVTTSHNATYLMQQMGLIPASSANG